MFQRFVMFRYDIMAVESCTLKISFWGDPGLNVPVYLCSSDNISWDGDNNPTAVVKDFKGHVKPYGPTFPTPSSILEIFLLFFKHNLLEMIVTETNRYASLCLKDKYNDWEKITIDELQAHFGFMILTGIARLPSIRDYWRNDEAFHYRSIADRISQTRFLQIHRFLHFVDNVTLPAYGDTSCTKIQKVKPILTYLSDVSGSLFTPGRDVAIDEAMVKFKGRSSLKQYMSKKPIKRGFKIWMRADSDSGYVSKYEVYQGKTGSTVEKGLGAKDVMRLTEDIHKKYHHVYFDNFFTGLDLMLNLLRCGTYSCGTMRSDRKGFPTALKPLVKRGLPKRGDYVTSRNGNLVITVWQDTKAVRCASTNFLPDNPKVITRKQRDGSSLNINCPQSIDTYNAKMGGVDHNDQLRGYYNIKIKSRRFYLYLFFAAMDISITNSYILSKVFDLTRTINLKEFQHTLANLLIGDYNSRKRRGRPSLQQPVNRFCSAHFPTKAERKGNRCYHCYKINI